VLSAEDFCSPPNPLFPSCGHAVASSLSAPYPFSAPNYLTPCVTFFQLVFFQAARHARVLQAILYVSAMVERFSLLFWEPSRLMSGWDAAELTGDAGSFFFPLSFGPSFTSRDYGLWNSFFRPFWLTFPIPVALP